MPDAGRVESEPASPPSARATPTARAPDQDLIRREGSHAQPSKLVATAPYILTLVAAILLFIKANQIEFDHVQGRIGPDAWPKLVLVLSIIAGVWGILKTVLSNHASTGADSPLHPSPSNAGLQTDVHADELEIYPMRVWAVLAGTLAYLWVLHYLGFFLSTWIFLGFIIYTGGYRRLKWLFLISVVGSLFFMTIFVRVVYVSLPLGIEPFSTLSLALLALLNL